MHCAADAGRLDTMVDTKQASIAKKAAQLQMILKISWRHCEES